MKIAVLIIRSLLGLIYLVFGLNFFLHFMPATGPAMSAKATAFAGGLFGSGYFMQYMKVVEILSGFFLLINKFTAFFLLILFPITLNIFLFHTILVPSGFPMGLGMLVFHLFLGFAYRRYYAPLFTVSPVV
jgi:putative oxidoreductase